MRGVNVVVLVRIARKETRRALFNLEEWNRAPMCPLLQIKHDRVHTYV